MTSWLGDQAEKVIVSIPHQGKDTVKIWRWLLIPFLRYLLMRAHVRVVTRTGTWIVNMLDNGRKFMCIEFGYQIVFFSDILFGPPANVTHQEMLFNVTSTDYKSNQLINSSLQSGVMPETLKRAVVTPLIKKRDVSQEDLSNYRPISNLSFLGKLIEKAAVKQIQEYATDNSLHNSLQSAYRPHHSVETALLKVQNDILTALDQRKEVILVLLDFTSAFDTIEHTTLHGRLKQLYGLGGTVLEWLTSYLYDRSHVVKVRDSLSNSVTNNCGVPQGSVIGPMDLCSYSITPYLLSITSNSYYVTFYLVLTVIS